MKKIFLDTNILLDVLLAREPYCESAQKVWVLAERKKVKAAISALSINNTFFIVKKLASMDKAYEAIRTLVEIFTVTEVNSRLIIRAMDHRAVDFEDAVQYCSALKFRASALISRDPAGFKDSKIPVMDCAQLLAILGGG